MCMCFLCCQSLPHSLSLAFSSLDGVCNSSVTSHCPPHFPLPSCLQLMEVCALPLLPVLASLTFPCLLVSSLCVLKCMLFLCHWSLHCSLSLAFSSLASCA
ncbi:hypothetical protein B0H14DRAFT_767380 [Mycena olivaceomarginata]|nr:hypothetical protein B0H14DRAFT_767380 [Mycena olivaceomarginata]